MYGKKPDRLFIIVSIAILGLLLLQLPLMAYAEDKKGKELPDRLVKMAVQYPGVEVPPDEDVDLELIFYNRGKAEETVIAWVDEKPDGWTAKIKTYKFSVSGIHVPSNDDRTLTFEAQPDKGIKPGEYKFRIKAKTPDGRFEMSEEVVITVKTKKTDEKEARGVKLNTSYPVLRGPSDAKFEFSLEVDSKLDKEGLFDLFAQGPEGWEINFKPAYEDKYISSLRLKEKASQTVAVALKPPAKAKAGEYPVKVRVTSGDAKAEVDLMVILTGTYGIEVGTPDGLLSLDARQGKSANLSIYVKNTGSAVNHNIKFMSFKPENWEVKFKPESLDAVNPGEFKQVEVEIKPFEEALVGDYSVSVNVEGEKAAKPIELRVTVNASAAWGWIGIGIIILVVIGLTGLFRWLGRR
ncbi:MAG TPA: hypothetical protein HPQ03_14840 [Deltaproteobacteria bacterium]|nr:hypothetical protein [Deltaproteobacteria bacterium]